MPGGHRTVEMPQVKVEVDRQVLAEAQTTKLRAMLQQVLPANNFYARKLRGVQTKAITLTDLPRLPFTTKQELLADQAEHPPYGTNLTYPPGRYCRLHQTSGTRDQPLRCLDTKESWQWFLDCWRTNYAFVGLKAGDRLFFAFSFGPFIGFWAAFEGALQQGNFCLPSGGMTTSARLRFLLDNRATVVCCTPTYAQRMAEVAEHEGLNLPNSPVRALIVAGEPGGSIAATKQRIERAWGARVFDHYGMTEIGSLGIECQENPGGFHLLETECIAEVIDAATGTRLDPGSEGELVLTNLGRWGSPLIRYRTGDRVVVDPAPCSCGRVFSRIQGGVRGRTDDMLVVKGNNVFPSAVENILRRFPEIGEYQIEVESTSPLTSLTLRLECQPALPQLADDVCEAVRRELLFRPEVTIVPAGTLPRGEMKSQRVFRKMK
jgi:phenylacetate-CoA ligase